ncbi:hypothetical protein ACWEFL_09465 [Streptomyces sp. NPDC004838]
MRTRITTAAFAAAALLALTACSAEEEPAKPVADKPAANSGSDAGSDAGSGSDAMTKEQQATAREAAGVPEDPTGAERTALIAAIAKAAPDAAKHEAKAVTAALNQCAAIHAKAPKLDLLASQRFSYNGVKTDETQGKQLNQALKEGFCKV